MKVEHKIEQETDNFRWILFGGLVFLNWLIGAVMQKAEMALPLSIFGAIVSANTLFIWINLQEYFEWTGERVTHIIKRDDR